MEDCLFISYYLTCLDCVSLPCNITIVFEKFQVDITYVTVLLFMFFVVNIYYSVVNPFEFTVVGI